MGRRGLRKRPPRWQYPESVAREYTRALVDRVKALEISVMRQLVSRIPGWSAEQERNTRIDDWIDDLDALMAALRIDADRVFNEPEQLALRYGEMTAAFNFRQFARMVNSVFGVNPIAYEPWLAPQMKIFVSENTALIKSIPQRFLDDVEGTIQRGIAAGTPTREITKELAKRFNVAENRAALIAEDQIGKFNGNLSEARQTNMGVTDYIWRTSEDEKVRHTHRERNGKRFSWKKPPPDGHPGEPVRCRCYAEPVLNDLLAETE